MKKKIGIGLALLLVLIAIHMSVGTSQCVGCKVAAQIFPQQSEPLSPLSSPTILSSSIPTIDCTADLNGDGVNDFLLLITQADPTGKMKCTVKAKDGSTGRTMWYQYTKEDWCYVHVCLAGDLDGDTLDDVLVNLHRHNWTTGASVHVLKAKKGDTGATLWWEYVKNGTINKCLTKCCCWGWGY